MASNVSHPYYPLGLQLPHYKDNSLPDSVVTSITIGSFAIILLLTWRLIKEDRFSRLLGSWERAALCWWVLCGCIHIVVEGYVSLNSSTFPGSNNFLAQLWKEYAKGDSRYMQADSCIIVMESMTAWLEGPGCFFIVWAFLNRHPMRHVLQLSVAIGQFYGTLLYFFTEIFDDFVHGPRFHPYYWWFYVFGLNSPWLVIPPICIYQSWKVLLKAQKGTDKTTGFNLGNGKAKIR